MPRTFDEWAQELVKVGHLLYARGMVPATSGNFSARLAPDSIAVTVSGRHKGHLTAADIMEIDMAGRSRDGRRPSAETCLHLQLYRRYPDVHVVLHHHSLPATLISQFENGSIVLENYELLKAFGDIDTHATRMEVPVFANDQDIPALAEKVDKYMGVHLPVHGYLISGHGLYTWGDSVETALKYVEAFEFLFKCELMKRGVRTP
jgi:methylthioribulose-1-phosphate dehydratase